MKIGAVAASLYHFTEKNISFVVCIWMCICVCLCLVLFAAYNVLIGVGVFIMVIIAFATYVNIQLRQRDVGKPKKVRFLYYLLFVAAAASSFAVVLRVVLQMRALLPIKQYPLPFSLCFCATSVKEERQRILVVRLNLYISSIGSPSLTL